MYYLLIDGQVNLNMPHKTIEDALDAAPRGVEPQAILKIEPVREFPRILTEEQRKRLMGAVDLREYASTAICGDGLELDQAEGAFYNFTDEDFLEFGFPGGPESSEIRELLGEEAAEKILENFKRGGAG